MSRWGKTINPHPLRSGLAAGSLIDCGDLNDRGRPGQRGADAGTIRIVVHDFLVSLPAFLE